MATFIPGAPAQNEVQDCIQACGACHAVCVATSAHCLRKGGRHAEPGHIRVMRDCAQACIASADFMLRGSEFMHRACEFCADLCDACTRSCERMNDDEVMQSCIDECRRCAEACRRMVHAGAAA